MKKIAILLVLIALCSFPQITKGASSNDGYILLQVEDNGEAWYVYPQNQRRYYLGRPADAFDIMKKMALGAKHDFIANTDVFPDRLSGLILLDVEKNGEAYYIYPLNRKKYYLGRPADAFRIMGSLGRGISNKNLSAISVGVVGESIYTPPTKQKVLLMDVPFAVQAPYGNWTDQRQEDGCEEASALMAVSWAREKNLTKDIVLKEVTGISDFLLEKYGEYRDISTQDIIDWIFKDYFQYDQVTLRYNITIDDIIQELERGNLIITPMNGQLLGNPNFKAPGPPRHMIVIRGYDYATEEFITNDPGTKNGELYRYNTSVIYKAIRDYPTGYHENIDEVKKNMIVVNK